MSSPPLGPGVTQYGVPERMYGRISNKPGWWFHHRDAEECTDDLIRVEQAGGSRFKASIHPVIAGLSYATAGVKSVLGTYPTIDHAHRAAAVAIANRKSPRLTTVADVDAVRGKAPASLFGDDKGEQPTKTRWA